RAPLHTTCQQTCTGMFTDVSRSAAYSACQPALSTRLHHAGCRRRQAVFHCHPACLATDFMRVDFYLIAKPRFRDQPFMLVCRLVQKALAAGQPLVILARDHAQATELDD